MNQPAQALCGLPNIGPVIAKRLAAVGIATVQDLQAIGAAAAYLRLKAAHPGQTLPVCYYLYALQGALEGKHWNALAPATKAALMRAIGR